MAQLTQHFPENVYDVRKIDGIRFGLKLFRPIESDTLWEPSDQKAFLKLQPRKGDVVVDVGAHWGTYSLFYSRFVGKDGRVIAFEPAPENARILRWNIDLNKASNVEVRREALGGFTGTATLKLSRVSSLHSFVRSAQRIGQVGEVTVPVLRLDDIGLSRVDLIKIDVEGYELDVLQGAESTIRRFRPRMQIEVHATHTENCKVCSWLEERGLSPRIIYVKPTASRHHWVQSR